MPIVGFNIDKTSAEKINPVKKGIKAVHNIDVKSIEEEKIKISDARESTGLKFNFEFTVDYQPNVGKLLIAGHLLYLEEEKQIKEILKNWSDDKKLSPELTAKLLNTAIVKCTIKALSMSQEVNLPPHLNMPLINPVDNPKVNEYIG